MNPIRPTALALVAVCALACQREPPTAPPPPTAPRPAPTTPGADAGLAAATEGATGADAGAMAADAGDAGGAAGAGAGAVVVTEEARTKATQIYSSRCASCHGAAGVGDGPAAAALQPKPRNFQEGDWQKSVTDEHVEKIIRGGGPAVGKSPLMPPNPDLDAAVVAALREKVRGFAKK